MLFWFSTHARATHSSSTRTLLLSGEGLGLMIHAQGTWFDDNRLVCSLSDGGFTEVYEVEHVHF